MNKWWYYILIVCCVVLGIAWDLFYSTGRRPEDFLFGFEYVRQIASSSILSEIFQLHLHVTAQPDESRRDVSPFVFRHCIHTMSEDARNILIANGKELPFFWSCDSPLDAIYVHDLGAETMFAIAFGRPDIQHCFHRVAAEYPDEHLAAYVCGASLLIDDVGKNVLSINSQELRQKCTFAWEKFGWNTSTISKSIFHFSTTINFIVKIQNEWTRFRYALIPMRAKSGCLPPCGNLDVFHNNIYHNQGGSTFHVISELDHDRSSCKIVHDINLNALFGSRKQRCWRCSYWCVCIFIRASDNVQYH